MGILSELKIQDYIYVLFFAFILTSILSMFITFPQNGTEAVTYFIELYILILVVFFMSYLFMKARAYKHFSYIIQDRLYVLVFTIIVILALFLGANNIYINRTSSNGFLIFMISIVSVIVILLLSMSNTALSKRFSDLIN